MYTDPNESIRRELESFYKSDYSMMPGIWNLMMIPCTAAKYRLFKEILDMHDSAARYWP